ncbi:YggS family pyridoxal phosphate-dependent enzyme [Cohaesibacter celericrescens]|uniref:Pyridoxal phosphate homeostasis protein n=1 Tax=Cohaesibacter celericrescens TaxID=2067669 RepID=A0A2N5XP42_9HYPH|nr:YggS family pyridoxal phosphate-dependent enzyme [Cohaesibacter celericrescens]PLW76264.1 YggS family pyridoxal phosphate-dependent enzyme [Cohaesibacter celericrescens]
MSIPSQLAQVRQAIAECEKAAERVSGCVTLIAVSKTFDADVIRDALEAGQRVFGENKVQETKGKWPQLRKEFEDVELHLIGPLQSNKAKEAVALFDVIHTVDRKKIARAIRVEMEKQSKTIDLFIQINTGAEPQKAGIMPKDADAFIGFCQGELGMTIRGLMCIPPVEENPKAHFKLLRKIAKRNGIAELSMGMSADYPEAIKQGATFVRVGSAIFGHRPKPHSSSDTGLSV